MFQIARTILITAGLLWLLLNPATALTNPGSCQAEAREQAEELLTFHIGEDDRIAIEEDVESLGVVPNPAAPEESFETLQVWGDVYKGRYRMRFQYAHIYDGCLLMGQEILEYADLGLSSDDLPNDLHGRVLELTQGDRACYLRLESTNGEVIEHMASFEICEREQLLGRQVILRREPRSVMAASCEGDIECAEVEWLEVIVEAVPE